MCLWDKSMSRICCNKFTIIIIKLKQRGLAWLKGLQIHQNGEKHSLEL